MRVRVLAVFCVASMVLKAGDQPMRCIQSLRVPLYSPLARGSGTSGTVDVRLRLDRSGEVSVLDLTGPDLLRRYVTDAIKASKFLPNCSDERLSLTFVFRLEGERSPTSLSYTIFEPPNRFQIVARPPAIIVD